MREIKFRGKRIDNGEWVYGYYVKDPLGNSRIFWQPFPEATNHTYHFVQPETVQQFTGIIDVNGNEIYEGDIVRCMSRWDDANGCEGDVVWVKVTDVIWNNAELQFQARERNEGITYSHGLPLTWGGWDGFEVVGNIHENPEMLPETAIKIP